MPMPRSSIGECVPDVTRPPSAMAMPALGIAGSSMTNAARRSDGPSSFTRRSVSTPLNSFSSAHVVKKPIYRKGDS